MQLERILQKHGFGTRKACRSLIRHDRVHVHGEICDDPFADIPTEALVFSVDGVDWPYREFATLMLYKPAGYECSRRPSHHLGVLGLLPPALRERGVQPVGRLDEDTTGLLIFTDDGQLNHRLTSPRHKVPKVYWVTTTEPVDERQQKALLAGVVLNDDPEPVVALATSLLPDGRLALTLGEGKYHQVKRMLAAVGNHVTALHRASMGELSLPEDLQPGQWRWLVEADLAKLGMVADGAA